MGGLSAGHVPTCAARSLCRLDPGVHPDGGNSRCGDRLCPIPGHRTADRLTVATTALERQSARATEPNRLLRAIGHYALPAFTLLAIGYLLVPIVVMIVFSFNDYQGKFNFIWHGFTLNGWLHPLDWQGLPDALRTSLFIAFVSTVIATTLGTLIGLALTRYQFHGRSTINGLIFLPMATPEIVMGASLLTLFVASATQSPAKDFIPKGTLFPLG